MFTPLFRPNEGVKSTVRVKRSPATTMHGLTSAPQTAAAQPLHLFPKHHACLWGCGKFQKKSKIRPSLPLSRVPETPAEFHKFRRLLASLCKPESKFLVAEPSFDTSRWGFFIASNNLCFCFCFALGHRTTTWSCYVDMCEGSEKDWGMLSNSCEW